MQGKGTSPYVQWKEQNCSTHEDLGELAKFKKPSGSVLRLQSKILTEVSPVSLFWVQILWQTCLQKVVLVIACI